jgi:hypothetical protein
MSKFIEDQLDGKLFTSEAKPEVRAFVQAYYEGGRHSYVDDYYEVVKRDRPEYSFLPTHAEYEQMAARIDKRLADWQREPYTATSAPAGATAGLRRLPFKFWVWAGISVAAFAGAAYCFSQALKP